MPYLSMREGARNGTWLSYSVPVFTEGGWGGEEQAMVLHQMGKVLSIAVIANLVSEIIGLGPSM